MNNIPFTSRPVSNAFVLKNIHTKTYLVGYQFLGYDSKESNIIYTDDISRALRHYTVRKMKLCRRRLDLNQSEWEVIEVRQKIVNIEENGEIRGQYAVACGEV
jgi:hypothetical protein